MAVPIEKLPETLAKVGKQIEFAGVVALSRMAAIAQKEVRKSLEKNFILRNKWTARGVRITPAKKGQTVPFSEVYSADWYIAEHEEGKRRSPAKKKTKEHDIPQLVFQLTRKGKKTKRLISKQFSAGFLKKQIKTGGTLKKIRGNIPFIQIMPQTAFRGIFVRRGKDRFPIDAMYKLQKDPVFLPRKKWFMPAVIKAYEDEMEALYILAIEEFLGKIKV